MIGEAQKTYTAILPCGGKGTRLAEMTGDLPKSLFAIGGQPLIAYSTAFLTTNLVEEVIFAVHDRAEQLRAWANEAELPTTYKFSEQTEPGVLGAIAAAMLHAETDAVVACNTDEMRLGLELEDVIAFHERSGLLATMVATTSTHLSRHRLLDVNPDGLVTGTELKPATYSDKPEQSGTVNAGLLVIEKDAMDLFDPERSNDWSGIIDPICEAGQLGAYVDETVVYFNVGTPEEYREAEDFMIGLLHYLESQLDRNSG